MLRAARFLSGYQLTSPVELENAMGVMGERLDIVSKERISEEFSKFLLVEHPSRGVQLLHRTGLMDRLFPSSSNDENLQAQSIDLVSRNLELRWACFLWSVSQEGTLARETLAGFRASNATASRVGAIIDAARVLTEAKKNDHATARRLLHQTRHDLEPAIELLNAYGQPPLPSVLSAIDQVRELEGNEEFQLPLDGNEVAELIGGEGPLVGEMLDRLMDQRLRAGPLSKKDATALIQDWRKNP
tara:strand:- start:193 stop:924 length:732 start_codon:yes stop_codon:yes gene_type:complete